MSNDRCLGFQNDETLTLLKATYRDTISTKSNTQYGIKKTEIIYRK